MFGGVLSGFAPSPAMVKQMAMAAGVADPVALGLIDKLLGGTVRDIRIAASADTPEGKSIALKGDTDDEDVSVTITVRKKTVKTLDTPEETMRLSG